MPGAETGQQKHGPAEPPASRGLWLVLLVSGAGLAAQGYWHPWGPRPVETTAAPLLLERAEEAELRQIPGLNGPGVRAILQAQQRGQSLQRAEDLERVAGLGPTQREVLRPYFGEGSATQQETPSPAVRAGGIRKIQPGEPLININQAGISELQRLPSIGPVLAQRIIAARSERPFVTVEELRRVPGIGPKTLEKLRPFVTVE